MFVVDAGDVKCRQFVSRDAQSEAGTVSCRHIALTSSLRKHLPLHNWTYQYLGYRGSTVVKVLCYKSEGRWFYSRWCHLNFSLT